MTHIKAMTLALEEFKHIKQWCLRSIGIGLVNENVLAALEEALAKQEQGEPVFWWNGGTQFATQKSKDWDKRTGGTTAFGCDIPLYTTPQPEQEQRSVSEQLGEPVALETVYETIIHWDEGGGKRSRRELATRITALYTTPQPAQKPLTDEQLKPHIQIAMKYYGYDPTKYGPTTTSGFVWLARAIEAAHGIKENT